MITNTKLKLLLMAMFNAIPPSVIKKTSLKRWIHHKSIPKKIKNFKVSGTEISFVCDQSPVTRLIFWLGKEGYEKNEIALWERLCKKAHNIVEIGSNIGVYTVFGAIANKGANFFTYEALPNNYSLLIKNLNINSLHNVKAINKAVIGSTDINEIRFFIPAAEKIFSSSTGGFIEGSEISDREVGEVVTVSTLPSTEALATADLIKLDVEGAEYEILSFALKEIVAGRPIILLEMLPNTKKLRQFVSNLLNKNRYEAWVYDENGEWHQLKNDDINTVILQDLYGTLDFVLAPAEKIMEIIT